MRFPLSGDVVNGLAGPDYHPSKFKITLSYGFVKPHRGSAEAKLPGVEYVSVVKINAITVPRERFDEFERRFAARAGKVSSAEGFEAFELLRPNDDREVCLVLTRWRSEEDFQAWLSGPDFAAGHSQHRSGGPVGTSSELWSFDVLELEGPPGEE